MSSPNAFLSGLVVTEGSTNFNLLPDFDRLQRRYRAYVPNGTASITVTPFADNSAAATIKVNGVAVTSGSASGSLTVHTGLNMIQIQVTASDMTSFLNYMLEVVVLASTVFVSNFWIDKSDGSTAEVEGAQPPFLMAPVVYDGYIRDLSSIAPGAIGNVALLERVTPGETDDVTPSTNVSASLSSTTAPDDYTHTPPRQLIYKSSNYYFVDANGNVLSVVPYSEVESIENVQPLN